MTVAKKSGIFRPFFFYIIFAVLLAALFFTGHFIVPKKESFFSYYIILVIFLGFSFATFMLTHILKEKLQVTIDYDDITDLYTLKKFTSETEKILSKAKPDEYSVISIDITRFRYIQTSIGTKNAHEIIRLIGERISEVLPDGSIACRNFIDNFTILINQTFQPIIEDYVVSMLSVVTKMGHLLPLHYTIDFSVGVYVITDPKEDVSSMLTKANTARAFGKNSINPQRVSFYTQQMDQTLVEEREILFDMNRAFEAKEFVTYYQPKFRFSDTKIIGAEALVRWKHKDKGLLPPGKFVPLFEKNGFIQKIDRLIFESACQFLDAWNKSGEEGCAPYPITISCNLSRVQLYSPNLADDYASIAAKYQISPSKIELELTENLMMDNKEKLLKAMNGLKTAGFDISIDDFGSGFSSLGLLKDLPANVLKLDKEFLAENARHTKRKNIIIHSVINMAKELELVTIAEGVEEASQADLLRDMGCDIAQGYLFAKPMDQDAFYRLLVSHIEEEVQENKSCIHTF